jgi:hypothetical protein
VPIVPPFTEGRSATELKVQRANTLAFIAANPVILQLIPQVPAKSGGGTRMVDGPARPWQKARLIDQQGGAVTSRTGQRLAGDGRQRIVQYQLLLPWDGEVDKYDFWIDANGIRWSVIDLLPNNGYERRAEVNRHGES